MEKLSRRSDGFAETPSGQFAVVPKAKSGRRDGRAWLDFKGAPYSEKVRVEWNIGDDLIVIDAGTAATLIAKGYAIHPTDDQVKEYNYLIDEANGRRRPGRPANSTPPPPMYDDDIYLKKDDNEPAADDAASETDQKDD